MSLGASPRAGIQLMRAVQAAAFLEGRGYAVPEDIVSLIPYVLAHRLLLVPEAKVRRITAADVLEDILRATDIPKSGNVTLQPPPMSGR